ncbi:membrane protein [Bacteroidia bacterium]|nr:membrane protein [Bacteroidia bacterium]GHU67965.1 membrane protein [Bacteroidia bacterium]
MSQKLKQAFKILIPLILGIIILYFLYRGTDFAQLWADTKNANWAILTFSLVFGLSANVVRALRWELLINPLGYHLKRSNLIFAVLGNYAVNFAIPRAGEIWRCAAIQQKEKIPFAKLFETLVVDRIMDFLPVGLFAVAAILLNLPVFSQNIDSFQLPAWLFSSYLYIGIFVFALIIICILIIWKENKIVQAIRKFLQSLKNDILLIGKMQRKIRFFVYTFGIWICYFLCFYIAFFAFDFTENLGVAAGLFIFVLGSISMVIPSNGGLGPWQAAVVFGLCTFLVEREQAIVFATAVFAFQSLWQVLCGLFGIFALSIRKQHIEQSSLKK